MMKKNIQSVIISSSYSEEDVENLNKIIEHILNHLWINIKNI